MSNINASALANLDKDALVALLLTLVSDEVAQAPTAKATKATADTLAPCGSTLTLSGDPCATKTKGGSDCGRHGTKAEVEQKRAAQEEFLAKRREYASKAKGKSKIDNKGLAAALRALGVTPNGDAWGVARGFVIEGGKSFDEAARLTARDYA